MQCVAAECLNKLYAWLEKAFQLFEHIFKPPSFSNAHSGLLSVIDCRIHGTVCEYHTYLFNVMNKGVDVPVDG
jgi:hypothetical protein